MIITRAAAVPLVTFDPYFSLWCKADRLTDAPVYHWTDRALPLDGTLTVGEKTYRFMGASDLPAMEQVSCDVTATSTTYRFEVPEAKLTVRFTCPLLLRELDLVSRPVAYIDWEIEADAETKIALCADEVHCHLGDEPAGMFGGVLETPAFGAAWMGAKNQHPLGHSGDLITIDWGYLYLAGPGAAFVPGEEGERTCVRAASGAKSGFFLLGYDDTAAINYFGTVTKAWWAKDGKTLLSCLEDAWRDHDSLLTRCDVEDACLEERARAAGGEDFALICVLGYRQAIAAHKLIADENGEPVFLSKENNSNGCIGTVDVSYPSIPLFLLYNPEYVRGMMRPVFKFASLPVWKYDFAPHDVGRYPYATGQVYGAKDRCPLPAVYPPYYLMPENTEIYNFDKQMPVEECGNMLIMAAAVTGLDGPDFIEPHMPVLTRWVTYLLRWGEDPGNQLCTDDFAGHLAHNVNLAIKATLGVACYALLLESLGRLDESEMYMERARAMAQSVLTRAAADGRTRLAFDQPDTWSLKYNAVWDRIFGLDLFPEEFYETESAWYEQIADEFGVPLDSRKHYTKADWVLWCAAFAGERRAALLAPVAKMLRETPDREAFSDWYYTETAVHEHFRARSVIGGVFMPLLYDAMVG